MLEALKVVGDGHNGQLGEVSFSKCIINAAQFLCACSICLMFQYIFKCMTTLAICQNQCSLM